MISRRYVRQAKHEPWVKENKGIVQHNVDIMGLSFSSEGGPKFTESQRQ